MNMLCPNEVFLRMTREQNQLSRVNQMKNYAF